MHRVIALAILVAFVGIALMGCGPKDVHQNYVERNLRLTYQADARSMVDDWQSIWMDDRPSRLSTFIQE